MSSATCAGVVAIAVVGVTPLQGQPLPMDLESLIALPGVLVVVEGVTAEAAHDGLVGDSVRVDIEDYLRRAGIAVLSESQWREVIGNPTLQLNLQLLKPSVHLYIYSGTLELRQLTVLARDSTKAAYTRTWAAGHLLGTVPTANLPALRRDVLDLVERFVEAYRSMNGSGDQDRAPAGPGRTVRSPTGFVRSP